MEAGAGTGGQLVLEGRGSGVGTVDEALTEVLFRGVGGNSEGAVVADGVSAEIKCRLFRNGIFLFGIFLTAFCLSKAC